MTTIFRVPYFAKVPPPPPFFAWPGGAPSAALYKPLPAVGDIWQDGLALTEDVSTTGTGTVTTTTGQPIVLGDDLVAGDSPAIYDLAEFIVFPSSITADQRNALNINEALYWLPRIDTPFAQLDWPNPKPPQRAHDLRTWIHASDQVLLATSRLTPFVQSDWPKHKAPIRGVDLTNALNQNPLLTTLPVTAAMPFSQANWPNPPGKPHPRDLRMWLVNSRQTTPALTPNTIFRAPTYSVTRAAFWRADLGTWILQTTPLLLATIPVPFPATEVSNPDGPPYSQDFRNIAQQNILLTILAGNQETPFYQLDWPLPQAPIRPADLDSFAFLPPQSLYQEGPLPFAFTEWPNPTAYVWPRDIGTWLQTASLSLKAVPIIPPFHLRNWPLPPRGAKAGIGQYTITQERPFYYVDAAPPVGQRRSFPRLPRSATHFQVVDAINRILAGNMEMPTDYEIQAPADNFVLNFPPNKKVLILAPAAALSAGVLILPVSAIDRDVIRVTSTQAITSLTVQAGAGQNILNAPLSITAGSSFDYLYDSGNLTWYRLA